MRTPPSRRREPAGRRRRRSFREDMRAARERLAALPMREVRTRFGRIRYLDQGQGPPVLAIHGITEGAAGALNLAAVWVPDGFRVVAPARFGYLGSDLPPAPTSADQAAAFAELLDALDIDRVRVLAASAGVTSALQLALHHPQRTAALLLVSSNVPGTHHETGPPRFLLRALFSSDRLLWAVRTYLPGTMTRLIGVPKGLELTERDQATLAVTMDAVFPAPPRVRGVLFDAYVSNPSVGEIPFEDVHVPALLVHARDDAGPPYAGAVELARRLPDARLVTVERGGHLMLGDHGWAIDEGQAFLRRHTDAVTAGASEVGGTRRPR